MTNDDIRAYYTRLFPLLRIVISAARRMGQTHIDADLWQRYLSSGKCLDAYLAFGLSKNEFLKRIRLGSSAQILLKKGASEQLVKNG